MCQYDRINDTILKNEKQGRKRIPYYIRAHAHARVRIKKKKFGEYPKE